MRILITGGAGYVGGHLCALLRAQGIVHMAFDNLSTGHAHNAQSSPLIIGDICDKEAVASAFAQFKPTMVIHLAALATLGACAAQPEECWRINVKGLRHVLDAMQAHKLRHIVHASSCAVYAPVHSAAMLTEEVSDIAPASLYGQSKLEGEQLLNSYRAEHSIEHVALRIFNVAGAHPELPIGEHHEPETHLLPLAIEAALGTRDGLSIFGHDYPTPDGTAVRDYVHVCDVAEALLQSARHLVKNQQSLVLNLGSGNGTSVKQLLATIEHQLGSPVPAAAHGRRDGDTPYLVSDTAKMRSLLGWQPALSDIDTIVKTALGWHRSKT